MTTPPAGSPAVADPDDFATWARRFHQPFDALHVVGYFAPETTQAYLDLGLTDFGMGYFASRSAAMGAVAPDVTVATFYVFAPALVGAYLPRAWEIATPTEIIEARYRGIEVVLRRGLGDAADGAEVAEASELAREAVAELTVAGRALCAAHARLPFPDPLAGAVAGADRAARAPGRRSRGRAGAGRSGPRRSARHSCGSGRPEEVPPDDTRLVGEQWTAGEDRLRARGLLDQAGELTPEGAALRDWVESTTDRAGEAPYRRLGKPHAGRLMELVRPLARRIVDAGILPARLAGPPQR